MSTNINTAETEAKTKMLNAQISSLQLQSPDPDGSGETSEQNYPYVIFQLFENKFAVNCKYVVTIEQVSKTTEIVNASREMRGISYYKNEPMSIYDLRSLFGLMSQADYIENVADIPGRIADHRMQAADLIARAESGTLQVHDENLEDGENEGNRFEDDSQKCSLGKWLREYKTKTPSLEVRKELEKAESVHDAFHRVLKDVGDSEDGDIDIGIDIGIDGTAGIPELEAAADGLSRALEELHEVMVENAAELNIILQLKGKKIGLIIDNAESVEDIDEIQSLPPSVAMTKYIRRLGLSKKERRIIFILEADEFDSHS
ncbi:MAG: chemotaxis protein CheW [Oscillospiraceae bacterium]|nr:chemotaxis protein CheW [Oscillospiraceae bacterium]